MDKTTSLRRLLNPVVACGLIAIAFLQRKNIAGFIDSTFNSDSQKLVTTITSTLAWLGAAWLVSRLVAYLIISASSNKANGSQAPQILINTISAAIYLVTFFLIAHFVFGKGISGLAATSGIATLIIGFAIREMIADFFSGMALNAEQPYRIGDWLEVESGLVGPSGRN